MAEAPFDDQIVEPRSVLDFSRGSSSSVSSVSSSDSDSSVAYNSDGEPAMVGNAEVGLRQRDAYKYEPTDTDSEPESDTTEGGTAGAEARPGGPPTPTRRGTTDWYEC